MLPAHRPAHGLWLIDALGKLVLAVGGHYGSLIDLLDLLGSDGLVCAANAAAFWELSFESPSLHIPTRPSTRLLSPAGVRLHHLRFNPYSHGQELVTVSSTGTTAEQMLLYRIAHRRAQLRTEPMQSTGLRCGGWLWRPRS